MLPMGRTRWAIAGGHIPLRSTGEEPDWTSRDVLCVLNTTDEEARLAVTIVYADREPAGPYEIAVPARRVRHVRFNDLIDPLVIPLDTPYAAVIESSAPVVVQWTRVDTGQAANAIASLMAFAE